MKYEIVELGAKTVVGVKTRTSNSCPDMKREIAELWQSFFVKGSYQAIPDKVTGKCFGLYTNYSKDMEYDVYVCCETEKNSILPEGLQKHEIPSGKYAKFVIRGHVQQAVGEFWGELEGMNLKRTYGCDFEEYQSSDMENGEIHIYISIE